MSRVYFASDPHFGHEKLCQGLRNMSSIESDNLIVSNWNRTITKYDTVYLGGDITFEDPSQLGILKKLKGKIKIIGGNHDDLKTMKILQEMNIPVLGCFVYHGYIVTHVPVHPHELKFFKGNIHGHIHRSGNIESFGEYVGVDLGKGYFNMNLEFNNYTPVEFSNIVKILNTKNDGI